MEAQVMQIMNILQHTIYDGITVLHVITVIVLILIINFVWKKLAGKDRPDMYEKVRCLKCGWTGDVSKYHRVCRKCGSNNVQKAPG